MTDHTTFTATFVGDLRKLPFNPHTVETPFGLAQTVGYGDAFLERDELEGEVSRLLTALREIAYLRPGGPCNNRLIEQMERIALDAIEGAEPPHA